MQEHPPQVSGGYWRRLKKEEDSKGFTLVELIVVIVILAILAAILIPGLLKWIDQAKDKKYELEAREIALAAEAALAKCYAEGSVEAEVFERTNGELVYYKKPLPSPEKYNFMNIDTFAQEMEKLTDIDIKDVEIYGKLWGTPSDGTLRSWDGNVSGFWICFVSSDDKQIDARYVPYHTNNANGWDIKKVSDPWSDDWDW